MIGLQRWPRPSGLTERCGRSEEVAEIVARGCDSHDERLACCSPQHAGNRRGAAGRSDREPGIPVRNEAGPERPGAKRREWGDMGADGKWEISMNTPMGAQAGTLDLKEDGNALTGTMWAAAAPEPMEITDGTVDGDNLTWKAA